MRSVSSFNISPQNLVIDLGSDRTLLVNPSGKIQWFKKNIRYNMRHVQGSSRLHCFLHAKDSSGFFVIKTFDPTTAEYRVIKGNRTGLVSNVGYNTGLSANFQHVHVCNYTTGLVGLVPILDFYRGFKISSEGIVPIESLNNTNNFTPLATQNAFLCRIHDTNRFLFIKLIKNNGVFRLKVHGFTDNGWDFYQDLGNITYDYTNLPQTHRSIECADFCVSGNNIYMTLPLYMSEEICRNSPVQIKYIALPNKTIRINVVKTSTITSLSNVNHCNKPSMYYSDFHNFDSNGLKKLFVKTVEKLKKKSFIKIPRKSLYKELIRSKGEFESKYHTLFRGSSIDFMKKVLNSPAAGKKLDIEIKDKEDKIEISLHKDNIIHRYYIPLEDWDNAFYYKEKISKVCNKYPILKLIRMASVKS